MDPELDEERGGSPPSSILSARWFRVLLGLIALALIALISAPYLLDWFGPAPSGPVAVLKREPAPSLRPSPPPAPPSAAPAPTSVPQAQTPPSQARAASGAAKPTVEATKPAPRPSAKKIKDDAEAPSRSVPGGYMVQVGAFQDATRADRLAAQLAGEQYPLQRATVAQSRAGAGGHEIVVIDASVDEVNDKLSGTTRRAAATREGVVIQPALPLKDAVTLSQELKAGGLTVKIRRAQGTATLHIVRVGAYPDRSRAEAVRKELEEKGFPGFIVQGARR